MDTYQAWYEIDAASLNTHIRYLVDSLNEGDSIMISYLDPPVEIPLIKRTFKVKPTAIVPHIRTSSVGRAELRNIRDNLLAKDYVLKQRRSTKMKILNQIFVMLPTNDSLYPAHVRSVLESVATEKGQPMPRKMIVGYWIKDFSPELPGKWTVSEYFRRTIFSFWKNLE